MITQLQRLFATLRRPSSPTTRPAGLADIQRMRGALLDSVRDCRSVPAQRLHGCIARATTPGDLWALRADAHDVIARQHCQTIAAQRLRILEPLLEGRDL